MKTYRVFDGSYTLGSVKGVMTPTCGNDYLGKEFNILACGCDLTAAYNVPYKRNDTIIVDVASGQIVFIKRKFLVEIKYCPYCGGQINQEGTY